jgi:hypothetical protein
LARPRAYSIVEHLKGSSIGQVPALQTDNRPGWKGLPETNILAYYKKSELMVIKSFITFALGPNIIKLFFISSVSRRQNKLERLLMINLSAKFSV